MHYIILFLIIRLYVSVTVYVLYILISAATSGE